MYYKAKNLAMNNGRTYHLAAILKRGKNIIRIGENTNKTSNKENISLWDVIERSSELLNSRINNLLIQQYEMA